MVDFSFFYSIILLLFLQEFFDPLFFKKSGWGLGGRTRPPAVRETGSARSGSGRNFCEQGCEQKKFRAPQQVKPTTFLRAPREPSSLFETFSKNKKGSLREGAGAVGDGRRMRGVNSESYFGKFCATGFSNRGGSPAPHQSALAKFRRAVSKLRIPGWRKERLCPASSRQPG